MLSGKLSRYNRRITGSTVAIYFSQRVFYCQQIIPKRPPFKKLPSKGIDKDKQAGLSGFPRKLYNLFTRQMQQRPESSLE